MAKVLVVDDHAANRELVVTLLNYQGHQPLEAADGAEALVLVRSQRPQLVICDILMPTMDGYEFVRELRADSAIAETEVIFYTANYHEREARHLAAAVGVSRILIKPCIPEDIVRAVDMALTRESIAAAVADNGEFNREHLRLITDKLAEKADGLQSANLKLSALTDLNLQLASERDPYILLDKVCRGARELIGAKYAFVCIRARHNGQAIHSFSSGLQPQEAARLLPLQIGAGLLGKVMAESKPLRFHNPGGNPESIGLPSGYPQVHNALIAPIVSLRLEYGWICLVDKVGGDEFGAEDERLLAIHAAQAGRIYENGSLYVQIERRAAEMQAEVTERKRTELELRESEERFRQISENIRDVFFLSNAQSTQLLYISPAYEEIWGRSRDEIYADAHSWADAIHPDDRERIARLFQEQQVTGQFEYDYRILRPDGEVRHIHARGYPIKDAAGNLYRMAGVASDVTEQKKAEDKIRRLNRVYAVLSSINTLIVRIRDREELYREACRIAIDAGQFLAAYVAIMDPDSKQLRLMVSSNTDAEYLKDLTASLSDAFDEKSPLVREGLDQLFAQGQAAVVNNVELELPCTLQNSPRIIGAHSLAVLPLIVEGKTIGLFGLRARETGFFDVEEVKLLTELAGDISFALDHIDKTEKLDYLAFHDQLTGLANRTLFFDRLAQVTEAASRDGHMAAVIIMNVDRFKTINDTLGRHAGDDLLKQIVPRFVEEPKDRIWYARMGADTFAGMIPETSGADEVARQIESTYQRCYGKPYQIGDTELWVSAKAGVALFPNDGDAPEILLRNAEAALKKAKAGGERYLFHTQQMTERVAERLDLENRLRRAVERDEFVLHYQPKVTVENRRIVGVEALIRWNDPATGLVPPVQFIPLLEETGLILEVGAWALRRAVLDHVRWQQAGLAPPRVAVNVSAIQLRQGNCVEVVRQTIAEGASPPGIDLEITESLIMEDIECSIDKLKAIRDLGLNISIDDFGTGYSSLAYLAKLPVSEIKIDRSFIITMLQEANTMTLVSTIVTLAHSLGLKVIAEGVDKEEQEEVLRRLGCDQIQGYLISEPVPFDAMAVLLKTAA